MIGYYLYLLDERDHIVARREVVSHSETEAITTARDVLSAHASHYLAIEVWQGTHKIRRIDRAALDRAALHDGEPQVSGAT
jgi:hypothetical protein